MPNPTRTRTRILAAKGGGAVLFFCLASGLAFAAPPAAPSNLHTMSDPTSISLFWQDNSNNEDGFKIERSSSASGPFTQIGTSGANFYIYLDYGLSNNTTFYYRVRAYNTNGNSGYSNVVMAKTTIPLPTITAQPQNITVNLGSSATFSLTATGPAPLSYKWQKRAPGDIVFTYISGATNASYTFTPLARDSGTQFRCVVSNASGSVTSAIARLTIQTMDNVPPNGSIKINNDAQYTNSTSVTLNLSAQDNPGGSGLSSMQFSNNNSTWSIPEAYATTKAWTLSSGDGTKTVYVKFSDKAGNWSLAFSDAIILNSNPPKITAISPADGSTFFEGATVVISATVNNPNQASLEYQFSIDEVVKRDWLAQSSYSWVAASGIHNIRLKVRNTGGQDTKEAGVCVYINPIEPPRT